MPSLAATDKNMSGYIRPSNNPIDTNLTDGSKLTTIQASISSLSSVILSSSSCGLNEGISSGSSIGVGVQIIEDSNVVETANNHIKRPVETRKKYIRIRQLRKSKSASKKRKYRLINANKKQLPTSKKLIPKKQINEEFSSVFCLINDMIETVEKSLSNEESTSTEKNMIKILLTDMWMLKSGQNNKTMVGCAAATNKRKSPINSNSNYSRLTLLKARRNYSGENENIIDNNEWDSSRTNNSYENGRE